MELKEPKTFDEQIDILKNKNIDIDNIDECRNFLQQTNYYRFSAYYLPFKCADGNCIVNTSFSKLKKIYEFDKRIRILILSVIEDIEIAMRTQIAYHHSHKYGAIGYMSPSSHNKNHDHIDFINHINSCINENRNTLVVKHHMQKYDGKFPLWVIIEFFSIGMLSHFYRGLKTADKKIIAKNLFGSNASHFNMDSWVRCITDLRNKCAHYARLYYASFTAIPKMPNGIEYEPTRRLFSQIYMLKFMYPNNDIWLQSFVTPLVTLIEEYDLYIDLQHIGFPVNWEELLTK